MLTLTLKLLIWSAFISIYLVNTTTLAQPTFVSHFCGNTSNYAQDSTYRSNLDTALTGLPGTNSGSGFFKLSIGQGNDIVDSAALCRGDVNPEECRICLNNSVVKLRSLCPNQTEAIGYYDKCFLKYSNQTEIKFSSGFANDQRASEVDQFNGALKPLLADLRQKAANRGPLLKFATGMNTSGPGVTIYALVQCIPDLSEVQCNDCLGSINRISEDYFYAKVGARILLPTCNFRYETYKFFNDTTTTDIVMAPGASSSQGKEKS